MKSLPFAALSSRLRSKPFLLFSAALAVWALEGHAAPLGQTTVVQTRPDSGAPIIAYLKAGSEPVPAPAEAGASAPAGWMAVSVPGPFTGYVQNGDLTKALTVKPGSSVYLEPKTDSGVLLVAGPADTLEITGLHGKWTQVRSDRSLVGYIALNPPAAAASPAAQPPAPPEPTNAPGKPVSADITEEGSARGLPRFIEGRFTPASRRFFWDPAPVYDWQLTDRSGSRTAYLDLNKLLLTERLDNYVGHEVVVRGTIRRMIGSQELVVMVESLQSR